MYCIPCREVQNRGRKWDLVYGAQLPSISSLSNGGCSSETGFDSPDPNQPYGVYIFGRRMKEGEKDTDRVFGAGPNEAQDGIWNNAKNWDLVYGARQWAVGVRLPGSQLVFFFSFFGQNVEWLLSGACGAAVTLTLAPRNGPVHWIDCGLLIAAETPLLLWSRAGQATSTAVECLGNVGETRGGSEMSDVLPMRTSALVLATMTAAINYRVCPSSSATDAVL
ncbi:hypothetical protein DFH08DRAFT_799390 [Mycena albidolilacea]|uniref:Uncharacterized protein n=1 Tax=Mycena albidolilacea TaxID=1033008 RepID=A0AAD7ALB4_9AGAR|nr:hypothetical protein DFH08DRAFT_799390 [Mycena albidolilacea]